MIRLDASAASIEFRPYSVLMQEKRCEGACSVLTVVAIVEDTMKKGSDRIYKNIATKI